MRNAWSTGRGSRERSRKAMRLLGLKNPTPRVFPLDDESAARLPGGTVLGTAASSFENTHRWPRLSLSSSLGLSVS